jgi:hypothetical protein
VEADLRVGDHDARYRIAGAGRLVLALSRQLDAAFLGHCEWLARSARVVVPTLRGASATCEAWLLGLVDLFGAGEVTLVADRTAAIEALALAMASPERVTAMEFVWNGARPREAAEAVLLPAFGRCLVSVAVAGYIDP